MFSFSNVTGNNLDDGQKLYNYRHFRAREVVENSFGILAARWRILGRPVEFNPDKRVDVVKACVALHHMLADAPRYIPLSFADEAARTSGDLLPGKLKKQVLGDNNRLEAGCLSTAPTSLEAIAVRNELTSFFQTPQGLVPQCKKLM